MNNFLWLLIFHTPIHTLKLKAIKSLQTLSWITNMVDFFVIVMGIICKLISQKYHLCGQKSTRKMTSLFEKKMKKKWFKVWSQFCTHIRSHRLNKQIYILKPYQGCELQGQNFSSSFNSCDLKLVIYTFCISVVYLIRDRMIVSI